MSYLYETHLFRTDRLCCHSPKAALAILILIALCFVVFTFLTPKLGIFEDPLTKSYGI